MTSLFGALSRRFSDSEAQASKPLPLVPSFNDFSLHCGTHALEEDNLTRAKPAPSRLQSCKTLQADRTSPPSPFSLLSGARSEQLPQEAISGPGQLLSSLSRLSLSRASTGSSSGQEWRKNGLDMYEYCDLARSL